MRSLRYSRAIVVVFFVLAIARSGLSESLRVDFGYRPQTWRSLICTPCDPIKTLVDFDGKMWNMNGVIVTPVPAANAKWLGQELAGARVPIAITRYRAGDLEITEEAFVSPVAADASRVKSPVAQRIGTRGVVRDWASPTIPCENAFRHAASVQKEIVHYRIRAGKDQVYTIVCGFCEGANNKPGDRLLDIEIEAKNRRRVDLAKEFGRNVPVLIPFEAKDEDGDGVIDLAVAPDDDCHDPFGLLNVLWVFKGMPALNLDELLQGRSSVPPLAHVACGDNPDWQLNSPSVNVILVRLKNSGNAAANTAPEFVVESPDLAKPPAEQGIAIGPWTLTATEPLAAAMTEAGGKTSRLTAAFAWKSLAPGEERTVAVSLSREAQPSEVPRTVEQAVALRAAAEQYWKKLDLPYDHIHVPDSGIQNIIEASIRGIDQNRDYKSGVPVYQVGPVGYRDMSCADGSFFCEMGELLGREKDASDSLDYFLSFQRANGRMWLYTDFWKENGLITWDLVRYAELTGDTAWLEKRWKHVEGMIGFIQELRRRTKQDPAALNYGLMPAGFGDGGSAEFCPDYSNVVWNLVGLRAAIAGAKMLGKADQAAAWQKEFDEMDGLFRKAIPRDQRRDEHGNLYLPNKMGAAASNPPACGQWAFVQSIFPGKLHDKSDPIVLGTLAMLEDAEVEGLPLGSGWVLDGVWPYFSHFQANACLWVGQGRKTAPLLYAIANHAAPVWNWWEEQSLKGKPYRGTGDMPHNWGSAEFVRQVRYMLALERGKELHLFEGLPAEWTRPGMVTLMDRVATEFGPISFSLAVAADGKKAKLTLDVPKRTRPEKVVVHLDGWSGRTGTVELPIEGRVEKTIEMSR